MLSPSRHAWAALLLRLAVGGLLLLHGIKKLRMGFEEGIAGIKPMLVEHGLPDVLAYGVYVGEIAAPVLLILGLFVPLAGLAVSATMGMAIFLAHQDDLLKLNQGGGWAIELAALFLVGGIVCALLGSGSIGLGGRVPRPSQF